MVAEFLQVTPQRWRDEVTACREEGYAFLVHLTAVDEVGRADEIRILAWFDDISTQQRRGLATSVPREGARLDSIADIFPAAAWLERQVHDFFAVRFTGGDMRPLLNHQGGAPLRKDFLLTPRGATPWPGALEPGESDASPSRRRIVPPGVPEESVLANPDATATEIALSAAGMRLRRGR